MTGFKGVFIFLIVCFVSTVTAYTCSYVDRYGQLHYLYCSSGACCGPSYSRYCCTYSGIGAIVGGVIGFIIFVSLITAITCCFCACCPGYRYRSTRTFIVTNPGPNYASTGTTQPYVAQGRGPPAASGPYTAKPAGVPAPPPYNQV